MWNNRKRDFKGTRNTKCVRETEGVKIAEKWVKYFGKFYFSREYDIAWLKQKN